MKKISIFLLLLSFLYLPKIIKSAIMYSNNFESDDGGLVQISSRNYIWERGTPMYVGPTNAYSGLKCWGTRIQGSYGNGTNKEYLVLTNLDLSSAGYAYLEFYHWYEFDDGQVDGGRVEVSTNGGATYTNLGNYPYEYPATPTIFNGGPGYAGDAGTNWNYISFDLTPYCGKIVNIRFRFESDKWNNNFPGWYIDDVVIKDEPIPIAGTGTASNSPFTVFKDSTNTLYFYYVAEKPVYNGRITLDIPSGWSAPQNTQPLQEGYVTVLPVLGTTLSVSNRTIIVDVTNLQQGDNIEIRYGAGGFGAIAPSTVGSYDFTMKSGRLSEGMIEIEDSPVVVVQPRIVPPYAEDFESGTGGLYATGNYEQWEYGSPANVGPSAAHSGLKCWATKISANYDYLWLWDERLHLPPIDLSTVSTNVYLSFWHWFDLYYNQNDSHDGVAIFISTNGGTSYKQLEARYGTEYNDTSTISPFWLPAPPYCWSKQSSGWKQVFVDLTEFTNKIVYLYFELRVYNGQGIQRPGYYLDDLQVLTGKPPVAGSGVATLNPLTTYPDSTNVYKIAYRAERVIYDGTVTIDIPAAWSPPQNGSPLNPGYVYIVSTDTNIKIDLTPNITTSTISVTITNMPGGAEFIVVYSNAKSQSSTGTAQFVVKSARSGESLTQLRFYT